ncbi:MAG: UDP-glucose 4-epimerase GalE [Elusimicrobia bacterium]|nr:UDP-glucose 4-epimerase GalE [Elusimicrobiota bacterium]
MKILITGGAGYIGSHANKLLNKKGFKTVVFDNLSRGHKEFAKWGEFFYGDIRNKREIHACFKKHRISAVMHFAAYAYVGESVSEPAKYYENNLSGAINLLDAMREFKAKSFIFSSTCAVYGVPERIPIIENHKRCPVSPYGKSKFMIEEILKDYESAYGIRHVNLRYFNAAGADPELEIGEWHEPETHLIPIVLRNRSVRIFGTDYETPDGTCIRDYVHVQDLAAAHLAALEYLLEGKRSDSFNLGNGSGFSVKEVIETCADVAGKKIKSENSKRRPGDPPVLIADSSKAKKILKWKPRYIDLHAIIETAWKWHNK